MSGSAIGPNRKTPLSQHSAGGRGDSLDRRSSSFEGLLRGMSMGLPSGQSVAGSLGLEPIADDNLRIGKAVVDD